jgi:hypothetical protein
MACFRYVIVNTLHKVNNNNSNNNKNNSNSSSSSIGGGGGGKPHVPSSTYVN